MPSDREKMDRLVHAFITGMNTWDYEALRATRSDDFIYQFLPTTLKAEPRDNKAYEEFFKTQLTPLFPKFVATPTTITHDTEGRKSTMFASVDVDSVAGPENLELVIMFSFTEDCGRISRVDEFFDSLKYTTFFAKVTEMMAQGAAD